MVGWRPAARPDGSLRCHLGAHLIQFSVLQVYTVSPTSKVTTVLVNLGLP